MFISLKNLSLMALLWAFIPGAQALTITPTETRYEAAGNRYYFTVSDWSTSDTSPSFCVNQHNPNAENCVLETAMVERGGTSIVLAADLVARLPLSETMGQAAQDLAKQGITMPLQTSVLVRRTSYPEIPAGACLTLVASSTGTGRQAFGPCVAPVAPAVQCDLTTLSNRIFYRPYQDTVEGAKSGISISVRCNGATTVRLMARYPDRSGIPLGRGVRATLAIGNQDIGMVAGSTEGGYDMEMDDRWRADRFIESTLHTDGTLPEAGELSGSTWIEIFIP